jgi:hypothetical protein
VFCGQFHAPLLTAIAMQGLVAGHKSLISCRQAVQCCAGFCHEILFLVSTVDTPGIAWVDLQPAYINFLATFETESEITRIDSVQSRFDIDQLLVASAACLKRHLLALHGIHT